MRPTSLRLPLRAALALGTCAVLAACTTQSPLRGGAAAAADLGPTQGNMTTGKVRFDTVSDGVKVSARLSGLKPLQEHGFHVHERGDCSSPDAMSAGGHFNPLGQPHGHHAGGARHVGDMPNLKADANGNAEVEFTLKGVELSTGGPADILGKAVIVHANPDDYTSQPAGNAGPRLACGVINLR